MRGTPAAEDVLLYEHHDPRRQRCAKEWPQIFPPAILGRCGGSAVHAGVGGACCHLCGVGVAYHENSKNWEARSHCQSDWGAGLALGDVSVRAVLPPQTPAAQRAKADGQEAAAYDDA